VDHNGMSPIGLLRWCLQYAGESGGPTDGVFGVVKERFAALPPEVHGLVSAINTFRNDYVAHQNKELTDAALARKALGEWACGLRRIWKLHGSWPPGVS
jgi:type III restriction enzyme